MKQATLSRATLAQPVSRQFVRRLQRPAIWTGLVAAPDFHIPLAFPSVLMGLLQDSPAHGIGILRRRLWISFLLVPAPDAAFFARGNPDLKPAAPPLVNSPVT